MADEQTVTVLSPTGIPKIVRVSDLRNLPGYEKVVEFYELPGDLVDEPAPHSDPTEEHEEADRDLKPQTMTGRDRKALGLE